MEFKETQSGLHSKGRVATEDYKFFHNFVESHFPVVVALPEASRSRPRESLPSEKTHASPGSGVVHGLPNLPGRGPVAQ
eukprot:1620497-Amphidinium_carterae.1